MRAYEIAYREAAAVKGKKKGKKGGIGVDEGIEGSGGTKVEWRR